MGRVLVVAGMVLLCAPALAGDALSAPARAGAMCAYVDPQTGEFLSEGPPLAVPGAQALPLATEEDSPVAGKMIRLSGRFRSAVVGHVAPDGSERIECVTTDGTRPPRDGP